MNYWINSNSGDYIQEHEGRYYLHLIPRWFDGDYLPFEKLEITKSQFETIKGFIPIKGKKLFSRRTTYKKYAPTLSDGKKGNSERVIVPTISESRDKILKELGL